MNSKQRLRTRIVGLGVLIGAGILASSLYSISILHGDKYSGKARSQYSKPGSGVFDRGFIYFTSKDGTQSAAASIGTNYILYMDPKVMTDPKGAYDALSQILVLDKQQFMLKADLKEDPYEELAKKLDEETAMRVRELGIPGIGVNLDTLRIYPGGALAAHELGIIGQSAASSTLVGKYGLERSFDGILSREASQASMNVFAEIFSGISAVFGAGDERGNLVTTIEPTVQAYLEKILDQTQAVWRPDEIGGIIMDPNTGEIYAMGAHPTFDPNDLKSVRSASVLSNPLVEHVYEMGSIMKPMTMAAALDSGAVKVSTTYEDTGCMTLNEKRICNYDQQARGTTPMQQILSQSLNMGAATIALKTGAREFVDYFKAYGITSKSGIDLPIEAAPITNNLKDPEDIDIATASYGQGIAVTPVGMIRALSVLANGGYLVAPHLVRQIERLDGSVRKLDIQKAGPVLKPQTVDDVKRMLVKVVDESLAKGALRREHYTLAAKTGTAAIADHENGGYYSDRWLHSFFGFFPAYSPRFIVFLYQIYPKDAKYASETLTKPFDDIATFLINYYNIAPDR